MTVGYNYIAARPLYIGFVRAFSPGQLVPDSTVASQGWTNPADVVAVGTPVPPSPAGQGAVSDIVEGTQVLWYGNSYPTATGNATRTYVDRLAGRTKPGVFGNFAVGARQTADTCSYAFGNFTELRQGVQSDGLYRTLDIGTMSVAMSYYHEGIVGLEVARNDAGYDGSTANGGTTTKARTSFTNALHALIALSRSAGSGLYPGSATYTVTVTSGSGTVAFTGAKAIMRGQLVTGAGIPANTYVGTVTVGASFLLSSSPTSQVNVSATGSGTSVILSPVRSAGWTSEAAGTSTNGVRYYTTTNGATSTFTVTSEGGRCWWVTLGIDSTYTGRTGSTYSVSVDGGTAVTGTTNDQTRRTIGGFTSSTGYGQLAVDLGVLAAGTHTIVASHTGSAGQYLYGDCVLVESATPATVIVPKVAQIPAAGYTSNYAGCSASWVKDQVYNGIIDTEVARWPADQSVLTWDPNEAGWDYTSMVGNTDGASIHLNDRGAAFYADGLLALVNTLQARNGLIRL